MAAMEAIEALDLGCSYRTNLENLLETDPAKEVRELASSILKSSDMCPSTAIGP